MTDAETKSRYPVKKILGWSMLFLALTGFLTILKFPSNEIETYAEDMINSNLSKFGMILVARESEMGFFPSFSYTFEKVSLFGKNSSDPISIDLLELSVSYFALLTGQISGDILLKQDKSTITSNFFSDIPSGKKAKGKFGLKGVQIKNFDLLKSGIGKSLLPIQLEGIIDGDMDLEMDMNDASTLVLTTDIKFQKAKIPTQKLTNAPVSPLLKSFQIPEINLSKSIFKLRARQGTLRFEKVQIGEPTNSDDDLTADLKGSIRLGKILMASDLDLNIEYGLSEAIQAKNPLLKSVLGAPGTNGKYRATVSGTLGAPRANPLK